MPAIQLFGLGIAAKSPTVTAKLMTNFYAETRPAGEHSMLVAYGTPGLELFCDVLEIARGALEFEKNATAFVVAGDTLWEIDGNGVKTNRGNLLTSSGRVSMAHNGVQIMIVDGTYGYIYNTVTIVYAMIADADFPAGPQTVCYLARRFIINVLNSSRFYVSDIDDGMSWDALMFANAESNPDPIIAVWSSTGQLVLLGANTTEFWGNSGTLDFPFVALQGAANEWGMDAVASIAKYDNTFAWLVRNRMGQVMVAQMNGYLPKKISTIDLDHIINTYEATTDAVAYSYMLGGHPMYVISFPSVTPVAPEPAASEADAEATTRSACVPVAPDPMPDRVLYLGVDSPLTSGTAPIACLCASTKWMWTLQADGQTATISLVVISDVGESIIATFATPAGGTGPTVLPCAVVDVPLLDEVWVVARGYPLPTSNRAAHIARYSAGTAAVDGSASVAPAFIGWETVTGGSIDPNFAVYNTVTDKLWIGYATSNAGPLSVDIVDPLTFAATTVYALGTAAGTVTYMLVATPYVAVLGYGGPGANDNVFMFNANTGALLYSINQFHTLGKSIDYDPVRSRFVLLPDSGLDYVLIDAVTGITTTTAVTVAPGHDTSPAVSTAELLSFTYYAQLDLYVFGQNNIRGFVSPKGSTLSVVDPDTLTIQSTYTYEESTSVADLLINNLYEPLTAGALGDYVLGFDLTHVKRLYLGTPCPGSGASPDPPPTPTPEPDTRGPGGIGGGPVDQTWLYDGSTGFWSKLKSFGIDRHRVQFSYQCAGQTIGADYANGKQYRITDTALSDNGEAIEGEIVGETLTMPDEAFLTINKVRVGMEVGVGNTLAPGDNPQVALSIARDSGAKQFGAEMWKPLGKTGEFHTRLEWRRLGTTRYFTAKLRITDNVKRVIVGASINPSD